MLEHHGESANAHQAARLQAADQMMNSLVSGSETMLMPDNVEAVRSLPPCCAAARAPH